MYEAPKKARAEVTLTSRSNHMLPMRNAMTITCSVHRCQEQVLVGHELRGNKAGACNCSSFLVTSGRSLCKLQAISIIATGE